MNQPLLDWFNQPIEVAQPQQPTSPNPCVDLYGTGPEDKQCKGCALIAGICMSRTFYKCRLRENTRSAQTDHKLRWPACAKFEQRTGDIPLYDGR